MSSLAKKDESEYSPETSTFWFEEDVTPDFHVKSESSCGIASSLGWLVVAASQSAANACCCCC